MPFGQGLTGVAKPDNDKTIDPATLDRVLSDNSNNPEHL